MKSSDFLRTVEKIKEKSASSIIALLGNSTSKMKAEADMEEAVKLLQNITSEAGHNFLEIEDPNWNYLMAQGKAMEKMVSEAMQLGESNVLALNELEELHNEEVLILNVITKKVKNRIEERAFAHGLGLVVLFSVFFLCTLVLAVLTWKYLKKSKEKTAEVEQLKSVDENRVHKFSEYIRSISLGNFDDMEDIDTGDEDLSISLSELKDQFKHNKEEDEKRSWINVGVAEVNEMLRVHDDLQLMANELLTYIIKYLNANQGCLFVAEDVKEDSHMNMVSMYAYGRKKYLERRIAKGEGLAGQSWQEGHIIHLKEVPDNYVNITSGLGEALPKSILITPLKLNEFNYGVVEIASFNEFAPYQIEFVERISEVIASMVSNMMTNETTKALLEETQQQAEAMKSQEEEMRQNLEELSATQEEVHRVLKEVQDNEQFMSDVMDSSKDVIFTVDKELKLVNYNKIFETTIWQGKEEVGKGVYVASMYTEEEKEEHLSKMRRSLNGESMEVEMIKEVGGEKYTFSVNYSPIKNKEGEIVAAAIFARDISEMVRANMKQQELLHETQNQAETMKAQEEELRQNLEELSATQETIQTAMVEVREKEELVRGIMDSAIDAISTIDKNYRIINFNKALADNFKANGMEIKYGMEVFDLLSEEMKPEYKKHYMKAFQGERSSLTDVFVLGGVTMYYLTTFNPLKNSEGEIIGAAVFSRDITETEQSKREVEKLLTETQQQTEEMKAQEEELLQNMEELSATQEEMEKMLVEVQNREELVSNIINATSDTIFTIDKNYIITNFNQAIVKNYESQNKEVRRGISIFHLMDEEQGKTYKEYYDKAFAGEETVLIDEFVLGDNTMYFASTFRPIRNNKGEVTNVVGFGKDVTELESYKRELASLKADRS
ncbi:PAS domain-containing protein [Fulvivirga maritima]|uniref:PAS domain-containing protein n=1 Tax=Fulvivirga maritima TaxID=2904247 RepID=UPI001F1D1037|nr:PAS domain-containing protein [Fulvivirga maritima]UII25692.1 PAS domain-containing protein [Fulvivirga maritima]